MDNEQVTNDLVVNVTESEVILALLEDKRLVEIHKEKRNRRFCVGDIYLGKVRKIMPALNAAFVDVGFEKDAFLHYRRDNEGSSVNSAGKINCIRDEMKYFERFMNKRPEYKEEFIKPYVSLKLF